MRNIDKKASIQTLPVKTKTNINNTNTNILKRCTSPSSTQPLKLPSTLTPQQHFKRLHPRFTSWYATCNPAQARRGVVELWILFNTFPVFPKVIFFWECKNWKPSEMDSGCCCAVGDTFKVINSKLIGSIQPESVYIYT